MQKKWIYSKTLWVNIIATVAIIVQTITGKDIINPEFQGIILTVINIGLRIITKHELTM